MTFLLHTINDEGELSLHSDCDFDGSGAVITDFGGVRLATSWRYRS